MKKALEYFDSAFASMEDTKELYNYKKIFIDEVTERANEMTHSGIRDENVVSDLLIDEHPDIKQEFTDYLAEKSRKKKLRQNFIMRLSGSIFYSLLIIAGFAADLLIRDNGMSWLILTGGFAALGIYFCIYFVRKLPKLGSIFHPVSRLLLLLAFMLGAAAVFFTVLFKLNLVHSWVIFLISLILWGFADVFYSRFHHMRFTLFFGMLYIPIATALIFVILSATGVTAWRWGWIIILLGFAIDCAIVFIRLSKKDGNKEEVEDDSEWNEH